MHEPERILTIRLSKGTRDQPPPGTGSFGNAEEEEASSWGLVACPGEQRVIR